MGLERQILKHALVSATCLQANGRSPNNHVLSYALRGAIDLTVLGRAASIVVASHPALRISFTGQVDGFGAAIVSVNNPSPVLATTEEVAHSAAAILSALQAAEAQPFSEDAPSLVRVSVLQHKGRQHTLVVSAARYAPFSMCGLLLSALGWLGRGERGKGGAAFVVVRRGRTRPAAFVC